jgi:hypothetical protein
VTIASRQAPFVALFGGTLPFGRVTPHHPAQMAVRRSRRIGAGVSAGAGDGRCRISRVCSLRLCILWSVLLSGVGNAVPAKRLDRVVRSTFDLFAIVKRIEQMLVKEA